MKNFNAGLTMIVILLLCIVIPLTLSSTNREETVETITIYTIKDIYFLKGNTITTESGDRFSISNNRADALNMLATWTAEDANEPIYLVTLTEDGACTYEILAPDYIVDKIQLDNFYWDDRGDYPMDVAERLTDSLQVRYLPLMYDY